MTKCKICSAPIENGKYCERCNLMRKNDIAKKIEKALNLGGKIVGTIIVVIISSLFKGKMENKN